MKILYLRTVYMLNLSSGGSVGHTSGVINALKDFAELKVVSNDRLSGVKHDVEIIDPVLIPFFPNDINEFLYNFRIMKKLKRLDHDFIYHRYNGFSFSAAYLSKRYKIPLILEFNSSHIWKLKNWKANDNFIKKYLKIIFNFLRLPMVKKIENYNLNQAELIIVVSEVLKENLVEAGISQDKILVNPNGFDEEKYNPEISPELIRKKYGYRDHMVIGFIGTFGQWHGIMEMINAIIRYYEKYENSDVRFLLIGDGLLKKSAEKLIETSEYSDKVVFTGEIPQEEAPQYLAACDIFLSPHVKNPDGTKFFGSPTKIFEYMAMGKPVIASRLDQIEDILEHGKTAFMVEPGNVEELTEAINTLVNDEEFCKKIADNAYSLVKEKYSWKQNVNNMLKRLENE